MFIGNIRERERVKKQELTTLMNNKRVRAQI